MSASKGGSGELIVPSNVSVNRSEGGIACGARARRDPRQIGDVASSGRHDSLSLSCSDGGRNGSLRIDGVLAVEGKQILVWGSAEALKRTHRMSHEVSARPAC